MECVLRIRFDRFRHENVESSKSVIIGLPDFVSSFPITVDASQLMNSYRRLDIHHVVLISSSSHRVVFIPCVTKTAPCVFCKAVKSQSLDDACIFGVICYGHAAFASHDVLGNVKAETADVTERPGALSVIFSFDSVSAILDDL